MDTTDLNSFFEKYITSQTLIRVRGGYVINVIRKLGIQPEIIDIRGSYYYVLVNKDQLLKVLLKQPGRASLMKIYDNHINKDLNMTQQDIISRLMANEESSFTVQYYNDRLTLNQVRDILCSSILASHISTYYVVKVHNLSGYENRMIKPDVYLMNDSHMVLITLRWEDVRYHAKLSVLIQEKLQTNVSAPRLELLLQDLRKILYMVNPDAHRDAIAQINNQIQYIIS